MAGKDYSSIINNATNQYNSVISGYKSTLAQQQQQQQGIISGYNDLQKNVLGGLAGSSAAEQQDIAEQYKVAGDKTISGMIGKGLYNSTLADSYANRLNLDQARAQNDRANKFATTAADKTTQLGLAGLGYQGQALNSNMQFAGQGLQYAGQGAFQIGNLAQNVAQMQGQQDFQNAQLAQQNEQFNKQIRFNQIYGVGNRGGIGGLSSYDGGGGSRGSSYGGGGGGGFGAGSYYTPYPNQNVYANPDYTQPASYSASSVYPAADNYGVIAGLGQDYVQGPDQGSGE